MGARSEGGHRLGGAPLDHPPAVIGKHGTAPLATVHETSVIRLGRLRPTLARGVPLLGEVVVVPGALLYVLVAAGRPMLGLVAVFGSRAACIGARLGPDRRGADRLGEQHAAPGRVDGLALDAAA